MIEEYLFDVCGVKPNIKGFRYLRDAIDIAINNDKAKVEMFYDVYDFLANKYNDKVSCICRAMKYAIQTCKDKKMRNLSISMFLYVTQKAIIKKI